VDTIREERSPEAVEAELTRFIERRHEKRVASEGERLEEDLWMATMKAYNERERRENAQQWRRYYEDQAGRHRRTLEALISHHKAAAQMLKGEGGP
jgi:hypothetical protein